MLVYADGLAATCAASQTKSDQTIIKEILMLKIQEVLKLFHKMLFISPLLFSVT